MILRTEPPYWSSAHRPVEFVYDHEERTITLVGNNGGFASFLLNSAFTHTPVAGEKLYVESGVYEGLHTITSVSGNTIITTTQYTTGDLSQPEVLYIRLPEIKLYSGYLSGEEYPSDLPLTLVATFYPENSPDNDVQFDVSEFLKSMFANRIQPPVEGIDFNMFNRYRLHFDGVYHDFYMALNSSIKTSELNALYVNTGAYLNSKIPPLVFACGKTILSTLQGSVVVNVYSEGGDIIGLGDYSILDYDSANEDYYTG